MADQHNDNLADKEDQENKETVGFDWTDSKYDWKAGWSHTSRVGKLGVISVILLFLVIVPVAMFGGEGSDNESREQAGQETRDLDLPEYEVLDRIEHISTRNIPDEEDLTGYVLITETNITDTPPDDMYEIVSEIAKKENLNYRASFYATKEAYEANVGLMVPEENREVIETMGGLEDNERYVPEDQMTQYRHAGSLVTIEEDGQLRVNSRSEYYKNHEEKFNQIQNVNIF